MAANGKTLLSLVYVIKWNYLQISFVEDVNVFSDLQFDI